MALPLALRHPAWRWLRLAARVLCAALVAAALLTAFTPTAPLWPILAGLGAAALAPLLWPRIFGTLPALLALIGGAFALTQALARGLDPESAIIPAWALRTTVALLMALAVAPLTLTVYMVRRTASAGVLLVGLIALPLASILFLVSTGAATTTPATLGAMLPRLAWMPAVWFPSLACCLAPLVLLISLGVLLVREARGDALG